MKRNHQSPKSHLEETLVIQMKREKIPQAVRGHRFHEDRRWQFDFCYPDLKLAFEVEGGIWRRGGGAHSSGLAILRDIEKYNAATLLGWRVFRIHKIHGYNRGLPLQPQGGLMARCLRRRARLGGASRIGEVPMLAVQA